MAVSYFPNLILLKTGIQQNFCRKVSTHMLLSSSFWHSFRRVCDTFFSLTLYFQLIWKFLVSFTGTNNFVVCDASFQGLCISQFQLLTSPWATPGIRTSFLPSPPGFYLQICARGPGFRRGQIFPEMNENLLIIFIFRGCFQETNQNGRKNSRFCLRKLHLSPRISLLNQCKE